jgi:hypothetical protein
MNRAVRQELPVMVERKPKEMDEEEPEKVGRIDERVNGKYIRRRCDLEWLGRKRYG